MDPFIFGFVFFAFIGIALLIGAAKTIKIVPQSSVLLIERLGKFNRVAASGLNIIVPFIGRMRVPARLRLICANNSSTFRHKP